MADIHCAADHCSYIVFHSSTKEVTHIPVRSGIHYPNGFRMCGKGEGKNPLSLSVQRCNLPPTQLNC